MTDQMILVLMSDFPPSLELTRFTNTSPMPNPGLCLNWNIKWVWGLSINVAWTYFSQSEVWEALTRQHLPRVPVPAGGREQECLSAGRWPHLQRRHHHALQHLSFLGDTPSIHLPRRDKTFSSWRKALQLCLHLTFNILHKIHWASINATRWSWTFWTFPFTVHTDWHNAFLPFPSVTTQQHVVTQICLQALWKVNISHYLIPGNSAAPGSSKKLSEIKQ